MSQNQINVKDRSGKMSESRLNDSRDDKENLATVMVKVIRQKLYKI